jgi:hypothetical protein
VSVIGPTRETLRKKGNPLLCIIPDCKIAEAHRVAGYRLCTIHTRLYREILYMINLVPLESKAELIVEIMCLYDLTERGG